MNFNLNPDDAKYLLAGFSVLIPFIIAWLPTVKVSDYVKFGILAVLSVIGGFLTVITTDQFISSGTLVQNAAVVLAAAQVFYYTAFRVLGLERVLFPQQALATEVKEQAKQTTPEVSSQRSKEILDPKTPAKVEVTTQIKNA